MDLTPVFTLGSRDYGQNDNVSIRCRCRGTFGEWSIRYGDILH